MMHFSLLRLFMQAHYNPSVSRRIVCLCFFSALLIHSILSMFSFWVYTSFIHSVHIKKTHQIKTNHHPFTIHFSVHRIKQIHMRTHAIAQYVYIPKRNDKWCAIIRNEWEFGINTKRADKDNLLNWNDQMVIHHSKSFPLTPQKCPCLSLCRKDK